MIPFDQIDSVLKSIEKDRAWLAAASGRKPDSIRLALAPNANPKQRSPLLQKALTDAIEREQAARAKAEAHRHQFQPAPDIPTGHTAIYLTGQTYLDAERASRIAGTPTTAEFCIDVIRTQARLLIERDEGKATGTHGKPSS
jgi:hypothetical protein